MRALYTLTLFALPLAAQIREAAPYRFAGGLEDSARMQARRELPSLRLARSLPSAFRLAPVDPAALPPVTSRATRAGVHRDIAAAAPSEWGKWELAIGAESRPVWRIVLQSPGAAGLRVHFRDFRLNGGRVWLHDGTGAESEIMGPYEDRGVYGDGDFWSDYVLSDSLVVEYEPAPSLRAAFDALPFTIAEVSHLFPGALPEAPMAGPAQAAATCHLDISCFPEWAETARSVGHILYEEDGNSYVCSGTLMSTTTRNNIPYFLTADHCVSTDAVARTVQSFWQYQTTRCNGPAANRRDALRTLGARYLVSEGVARGDYSLLRLNSVPTGVIFSGWKVDAVGIGTELVGIHHPSGDYKRFSRGPRVTTGGQLAGANPAFYYTVSYSEGLIEGGSSGSGLFSAPGVLVGMLSSGPKTETPCAIKPFRANYGKLSDVFGGMREYLEGRVTDPGTTPPPSGGVASPQVLTSGAAREFTIGPVTSPTLLNGASGYAIDVPQGATRLEIRITSIGAEPELGFWARYESAPAVESGRVVADHASPGTSGFEVVTVDLRSNPALRSGRYYIALGLFTTNVTARGTITATVTGTPAPTTNLLVPGQARNFSIGPVSAATLLNGQSGFRVEVPEGARRLDIRLAGARPELDIDLHVRHASDPTVSGGSVIADHSATGDTGVEEIGITQASSPPLRAGTYFIALALIARNVTVTGTITATITTGSGNTTAGVLTSGAPVSVDIPAVTSSTLRTGTLAYQIAVPAGATRLDVRLSNGTAGIDYDLFVRRNSPPEVVSGAVVTDYRSTGDAGDEFISITSASTPPLQAGSTYYIAIGVFTLNRAGSVTLTATAVAPTAPPPTGGGSATGTQLRTGAASRVAIPAVTAGRLLAGSSGYYVTVPAGTQRLELLLNSATSGVDLDLFVTAGVAPSVQGGKVQAEYRATGPTGNETIVITGSAAQPLSGNYFVGIGVFTTGVDIEASLTANVSGSSATGPVVLQSGVAQNFTLAAVTGAQLAPQSYAVEVPEGATRLEVRLTSATAGVDVDLYARFGSAPGVQAGKVVSDHSSEGPAGSEVITITSATEPALRAGRYFIALGIFSTGTAIEGSVVATVVGGSNTPPVSRGAEITPQSPGKFSLPAVESSTLFNGDYTFRVVVPEGTRSMQLRLSADAPSIDTDLYVRYEADVALNEGFVVSDHAAESDSGNELLTINTASEPPLRPGTYYVSLALFARNTPATGTISVTFERDLAPPAPPQSSQKVLAFGTPAQFTLPAATVSTLYYGDFGYRIDVPSSRGRLEVAMRAADAAVDVDLYLRHGAEPSIEAGRTVTDHRAAGDSGDETIMVSTTTNPALRSGPYFVAFGLFTLNREARGTLTATFTPENQPAGGVLKEYDLTPQRVAAPEETIAPKAGYVNLMPLGPGAKWAAGEGDPVQPMKRRSKGTLKAN